MHNRRHQQHFVEIVVKPPTTAFFGRHVQQFTMRAAASRNKPAARVTPPAISQACVRKGCSTTLIISQALEPASSTDDTTSSTSVSNGTTSAVPPLSDITLTELKSDISTAMWNEQMVLADQPGVCNLSLGYPDYAGSRLAREAAAAATVEPTLVRLVCCNFCKWKSSVL